MQREAKRLKRLTRLDGHSSKRHLRRLRLADHSIRLKHNALRKSILKQADESNLLRKARAATSRPERLWDFGVIPYEIESNFSGTSTFY